MPAHRKPTNVHALSGAFDKNPQRKGERSGEPIPAGPIGDPPKGFKKGTRRLTAWLEIVENAPPKVLTNADRVSVEMASNLMALYRKNPNDFPAAKLGPLINLFASFGMTPTGRSKINVGTAKPKNDFDDF